MVDLLSTQRNDAFPSNFKKPRISAYRQYPSCNGTLAPQPDPTEAATCAQMRKYPAVKIRKGVLVRRDFPAKMNASQTFSRNQIPSASVESHSAFEIPMVDSKNSPTIDSKDGLSNFSIHVADCKKSDASMDNFSTIEIPMLDCKQLDAAVEIDCKLSNAISASGANFHESVCIRQENISVAGCSRKLGAPTKEGPSFSPFAEREHIHTSEGGEDKQELKQENVPLVKDCNQTGVITDVKESSLPKVTSECAVVDEPSSSVVVRDEHNLKESLNDGKRENLLSITFTDEECERVDKDDARALLEVRKTLNTLYPKTKVTTENEQDLDSKDMAITENEHSRIASNKVKEVINLFQELYIELSQQSGRKSKGSIHLEVASILQKQQKRINMTRRLGPILGIEVGDYFDWRAELYIIGLHCQVICGIDYMELDGRILATSIVDSGVYDNFVASHDDQEFPDVLVYSGVGQNAKKIINKERIEGQKLERGNLALKNSAEAKTPIRVIRKVSIIGASSRKIVEQRFVYDGLYFVDSCLEEIASSGKLVFKFVLKRFPGQPKVNFAKLVGKEHVCVNDISEGKERIPIPVVNAMDEEKPPVFNYVTNVMYPKSFYPSVSRGGCDCSDGCVDFGDCPCVKKNGGQVSYNDEGRIMKAKRLVIECGLSCNCSTSCINRVSQNGIRFPLEVFKTESKGWGVRSPSFIPSGSFICEYTGEILGEKEAEKRIDNDEYLFDIGNKRSIRDADTAQMNRVRECFTVDAALYGNVGRFINHSCSPNLFAQNVLFDHDNNSMPHIMLFAMEDIPPKEELTYDYNYRIGEVCDIHGNIKIKACHCGSKECTGRMY